MDIEREGKVSSRVRGKDCKCGCQYGVRVASFATINSYYSAPAQFTESGHGSWRPIFKFIFQQIHPKSSNLPRDTSLRPLAKNCNKICLNIKPEQNSKSSQLRRAARNPVIFSNPFLTGCPFGVALKHETLALKSQPPFLYYSQSHFHCLNIYNNLPQPSPMHSQYNFNALDLSTCNNFEYAQSLPSPPKQVAATSDDYECMLDENPLYQKSTENLTNAYEISFENNFMGQHESVFKRELGKYMESFRTCLEKNDRSFLKRFPDGLVGLNTKMTCEELMMMTESELGHEEKVKFLDDLKHYQKLGEFMNMVADHCPSQIGMELVHVAQQVLEAFLASEHQDNLWVEASTLLQLCEAKANLLSGVSVLSLSCIMTKKERENSGIQKQYERFIEVFCGTVALIIAQFFENPFNNESSFDGHKRPLNRFTLEEEDEESIERMPQKKRKFSF